MCRHFAEKPAINQSMASCPIRTTALPFPQPGLLGSAVQTGWSQERLQLQDVLKLANNIAFELVPMRQHR